MDSPASASARERLLVLVVEVVADRRSKARATLGLSDGRLVPDGHRRRARLQRSEVRHRPLGAFFANGVTFSFRRDPALREEHAHARRQLLQIA